MHNIGGEMGQLQHGDLIWLVHRKSLPPDNVPGQDQLSQTIQNIEGPWIYNSEDVGRLWRTMRNYYTASQDILASEQCLVDTFGKLERDTMNDVFVKIQYQRRFCDLFELRVEANLDPDVVASLQIAVTQPTFTYFFTARFVRGRGEDITEETVNTSIKPYIMPGGTDFEPGSMTDFQTFLSNEDAREYAKRTLESKDPKYKDKLPDNFKTDYGVQWMINPVKDTWKLKWVAIITKMRVNNENRRQ